MPCELRNRLLSRNRLITTVVDNSTASDHIDEHRRYAENIMLSEKIDSRLLSLPLFFYEGYLHRAAIHIHTVYGVF